MGKKGIQEPSPAKLARIAADQQRPEFREWLADMDSELNTFFTEDIPDLPDDPYTPEGLLQVEELALVDFWDDKSKRNWLRFSGRIERYLGELVVRTVEGEWKYINVTGEGLLPVIETPFRMAYFEPAQALKNAMSKRDGQTMNRIYGHLANNYSAWIEHGRLPLRDWVDFQSEQRRGLR